jgi:catechol 2,3-dioxygenase-like lactoylglutathione lyase family enzyme
MRAVLVNPILNVSDLQASFAWFERLGWQKMWDHGDPPTFGAVRSGDVEVFLCQNCQGAGAAWMSIWVEDVDAVYQHCLAEGLTVTRPPTDEPWNVREMHVVHPDGHTLRISRASFHTHDHDHEHEHDHDHGHHHEHPH